MATPHLEVIPRIIDTSIAAAYQAPSETAETPTVFDKQDSAQSQQECNNVVASGSMTVTQKFFSTLRDYIIPILFIVAVIAIIYVLWKYWTTYRASTKEPIVAEPNSNQLEVPTQSEHASSLDLSKYILSNESSNGDNESVQGKLSTIDELEETNSLPSIEYNDEEEDESSEASEDEEEDESSEASDEEDEYESESESIVSVPDFNVISNLINQPIDEYDNNRFEYLNDDDTNIQGHLDAEETHMDEEEVEPQPVPKTAKRAKRSKRVVL